MRDPIQPRIAKWPFLAADVLLLGTAFLVYRQSPGLLGPWQVSLLFLCVAAGGLVCVPPFILEYRLAAKLAEADGLSTVLSQIQNLEEIAGQITGATGRWHNVQEASEKVSASAHAIAERMTAEAKAFAEFMQKANDSEKATLRLEIDKLRRAESDWLQVLVRTLDHVYALHLGAVRS